MKDLIYELEIDTRKLGKFHMLERLQFSRNLQTAIKATDLLSGKISSENINGAFLTAVLESNYKEAAMRADERNLEALNAKNFSTGKFIFAGDEKAGYIKGEKYYLKIQTANGVIYITPTVDSNAEPLVFPNLKEFINNFGLC